MIIEPITFSLTVNRSMVPSTRKTDLPEVSVEGKVTGIKALLSKEDYNLILSFQVHLIIQVDGER